MRILPVGVGHQEPFLSHVSLEIRLGVTVFPALSRHTRKFWKSLEPLAPQPRGATCKWNLPPPPTHLLPMYPGAKRRRKRFRAHCVGASCHLSQGELLEKPHDFSHLHQRTIRITYTYVVNAPGKWSIFYLGASDKETSVLQDKRCKMGKVTCGEHL